MSNPPRYRKSPAKLPSLDTPEIRAVAKFLIAIDSGDTPDAETLAALSEAFGRMLGGEAPNSIWGAKRGRPNDGGIDADMVVSAYIEIEQRADKVNYGKLGRAQRKAISAFNIQGDESIAQRQVERHWARGRVQVRALTTDDLRSILAPHEITDKK